MIENLAQGYLGEGLREIAGFVVIIVVLMIRPYGLFGSARHRTGLSNAHRHYKETIGQIIALSDSKVVWGWTAALIAALLLLRRSCGAYTLTLMVSALMPIIGAVGLNLLTGTTGLISLGQAGFLAVGAYTNAILLTDTRAGLDQPACGRRRRRVDQHRRRHSVLRLKGLYLAITTLAFAFIINHIILYAERLTHGPNGVFVTGARLFGFGLQRGHRSIISTLALAIATIFARAQPAAHPHRPRLDRDPRS